MANKINLHSGKSYEKSIGDGWLTSPHLLKSLGKFDTDPCTPVKMPWRTAKKMYSIADDGLSKAWNGRVWLNPPYSNVFPFVKRFADHKNGIALLSAKSTDSKWGQLLLASADAVLFLKGRLLFHYPDGKISNGKWLSNMLVAYGKENVIALKKIMPEYPGVLMRRAR
jgi:DNA N-6-adenine-methyltransferase (Dam)